MRSQLLIVLAFLTSVSANAQSSRFDSGLCGSQGSWLKNALDQSTLITGAIKALKDEPACTAMIAAMENTPDIQKMSESDLSKDGASMGMMFHDLSAISNYMRPEVNGTNIPAGEFKKIIQGLVFRKSFDAIADVKSRGYVASMSDEQKNTMNALSERLRSFLDNSKKIAKASMSTTQSILSALPKSKLCFDRKPSEAATIFGAVVNTMAALATNGQINEVGSMIGSIMRYSRESHYMDNMAKVEVERFRASVSCLIESTTENYCAMVDGSNNLKFLRSEMSAEQANPDAPTFQEQVISNPSANKTLFPMLGLNLLMRDAPIVTDWMQRILFGIDPKLDLEAQMKNNNWTSYVNNIQKDNNVRANFRDQQSVYLASTKNDDNSTKLGQVKKILESLLGKMDVDLPGSGGGGNFSNTNKSINFYENFKGSNQMAWFLLGLNGPPEGFGTMNVNWETVWNGWQASGSIGKADTLLETIGQNMGKVSAEANRKAISFINARMIVDPLNLVTEATKGPGVSPYEGLVNIKNYNDALIKKFQSSITTNATNTKMTMHLKALKSIIPLLTDTNQSITRILTALDQVQDLAASQDKDDRAAASKKIMDIIYDSANMMLSRDSFFDTRLRQIVQYDITDSIYSIRATKGTDMGVEMENLFARGSSIISTLSNIFTEDPVLQSLDIAQAMEVHKANLKSTENLFARIIFNQILDINCRLYGGRFCNIQKSSDDIDPVTVRSPESIKSMMAGGWASGNPSVVRQLLDYISPKASDDDPSLQQLRGKLCAQSLAFETRDMFTELCRGARLVSEYSGDKDPQNLNMNYDQTIAQLNQLDLSGSSQWKTDKRNAGTCAFRNYMRKNYVYRMYMDYKQQ